MPVEGGRTDQRSSHVPAQVRPGPATRERFEQVLTTLCANARGDVHLDLAELHGADLDTAMVEALVRAAARLTAPAKLVLHNPPEAMVAILRVTSPDHAERGILLR